MATMCLKCGGSYGCMYPDDCGDVATASEAAKPKRFASLVYEHIVASKAPPPPEQKTGTELRREVLAEVEKCVCRDRQNTYGDAEDNFADIAAMASIVLRDKLKPGEALDARDVAAFSACIKLARIRTSPGHLDNWVDLAGYAVCGGGIVKRAAKSA